jgi:hypothetical protein
VIAALIEVGRLPDPAKAAAKKSAAKKPPKPLEAQPAAAGSTQPRQAEGTVVDTGARRYPDPSLLERGMPPVERSGAFFVGSRAPGNVRALRDVWKIRKPGSKPMGALDAFGQPHFLKRATPPGGNCNPEIRTNP